MKRTCRPGNGRTAALWALSAASMGAALLVPSVFDAEEPSATAPTAVATPSASPFALVGGSTWLSADVGPGATADG